MMIKDYQGLEDFNLKFQTAKNHNSKEIRLTIQEAENLFMALNLLLSRELTLSQQVIKLQDQLIQRLDEQTVQVDVSGGTF